VLPPEIQKLSELPGLIATCVTSGVVEPLYAECHEAMARFNDKAGFTKVEYRKFYATLVEAGRDSAIQHMMQNRYAWCVQIDADATFPEDALIRILNTAYNVAPDSDAVGAYCQLKGSYAPTFDSGTGTWQIQWPGAGVIPVIRTGAHFLLTKRSAFEKMGQAPWFRTRISPRPLDVLAEVDNLARTRLSGRNPFSDTTEWQQLLDHARLNSAGGASSVGEDSGFCDRLLASGGRLYVDTDLVTGHIEKRVIQPKDLKDLMNERQKRLRLSVGLL
jgi:hypothetical protein